MCLLDDFSGFLFFFTMLDLLDCMVPGFLWLCLEEDMDRGKNTSVVLNLKKKGENTDLVNHKNQFPFPCHLRFFIYY